MVFSIFLTYWLPMRDLKVAKLAAVLAHQFLSMGFLISLGGWNGYNLSWARMHLACRIQRELPRLQTHECLADALMRNACMGTQASIKVVRSYQMATTTTAPSSFTIHSMTLCPCPTHEVTAAGMLACRCAFLT